LETLFFHPIFIKEYSGMPNTIYSFTLFNTQAAPMRDVFLGHAKLPAANDEEARRIDIAAWETHEAAIRMGDHRVTRNAQTTYMRDILSYCKPHTAPMIDLDRVHAIIDSYFLHRHQNIMIYLSSI
jgi:hypothetical protein